MFRYMGDIVHEELVISKDELVNREWGDSIQINLG